MMEELAESEPMYSLLPWIKSSQFLGYCVNVFGFMKEKNGNLGLPSSERYQVPISAETVCDRYKLSVTVTNFMLQT